MESSGGEIENSSRVRSSSVGARPRPRLHRPSRAESAAAVALDVRCACQFFQTQSLLPERVNPVGHGNLDEFEVCSQHGPSSIGRFSGGSDFGSGTKSERNFTSISSITHQPMNSISGPKRLMQPDHQSNFNAIHLPHDFHLNVADDRSNLRERHASASVLPMTTGKIVTDENHPPILRQRDPSQSSLVRRRMSEDRQSGSGPLSRTLSQSSNVSAGARVITQKDPTQSAILKRKMYNNKPSSSMDAASSAKQSNRADHWCMRTQPLCIPQNRINSERTFYRDSAEPVQIPREPSPSPPPRPQSPLSVPPNSQNRMNQERTFYRDFEPTQILLEPTPLPPPLRTLSPLSVPPISNRENLLDANRELTRKRDEIIERESRNLPEHRPILDDPTIINADHLFKRDEEWEIDIKVKNAENANKLSEQPKSENILKMLEMTIDRGEGSPSEQAEPQKMSSASSSPPPPEQRKMLLTRHEVHQTIAMPKQIQIQHVASFDSTLHPLQAMEADASEYTHSKIFDNYSSTNELNRHGPVEMQTFAAHEIVFVQQPNTASAPKAHHKNNNRNISTPDLHLNYIKQRDPSLSRFTRERYTPKASTPFTSTAAAHENRPLESSLLPPVGNFPERRASEQVAADTHVIQQKDLRTSKLLERRRRNLSQTSLRDGTSGQLAAAASFHSPVKMVKTVSFEFEKQNDFVPYENRRDVDGVHGRRVIHR